MSTKLLLSLGAFVIICVAVFSFSFPDKSEKALTEELPDETRFSVEVLDQKLFEPMQLAITPENKVIYIERRGAIKMYDPAKKLHRVIANLNVYFGSEDGLLGMALDPEYDKNKWIYFFYSPAGKPLAKGEKAPVAPIMNQRVSRFTMLKDSILMKSEKVILEIPVIRACCHSGGSVEFGPGGNLFISTGDNTNPSASEGYSPIDERPDRISFDAQKSAANTHDLRGKILRIKPTAEGSYTIPDGNLFPKDGSGGKPEIYTMGDRNPWRISIDQKTGYLYWGEIGPDAGVDSAHRGPRGYDEINQARKAGNFGWPYFIGNNIPYREYNFETKVSGKEFNPAAPVNNSVNNTGSKMLPPPQPAFIWYPYADSPEFPEVGKGARTSMAGPVFYKDQFKKGTETFPPYYEGKLFIYEWSRSWIKTVAMDAEGNYKSMEPFMPNTLVMSKPCDMAFGPDGALYVLEYGNYWKSINDDSRLIKIRYHANNRRPVAKASADRTTGAVPLKVNFSSKGSLDHDKGDQITYTWKLKDGRILSKEPGMNYNFTKPGVYNVTLVVTDKRGESNESMLEIRAGNESPSLSIETSDNKSFYWDDQVFNYAVKVKDREDGIVSKNVQVQLDYLAEGKDQILAAPVNSPGKDAGIGSKGKTLVGASDCKTCHAPEKRTVGPGFLEIAKRYKGKNVTLELVNKVRSGGSGKWGEVPMAAHPQVSKEDATQMVKYILSLADVKKNTYLPMTGTLKTKKQESKEGVYYFSAAYTDRGANGMKPLTARETVVLRNAFVRAYDYDGSRNVMNRKTEEKVQFAQDSAYISFNNIDLTGIRSITVRAGSGNKIDGTLEIRSGSDTGALLASKFLPAGGGIKTYEFPVSAKGFQDVYFVFRTDKKVGMFAPFDIISLMFNK